MQLTLRNTGQVKPLCVQLASQRPLSWDNREIVLSLLAALQSIFNQPDVNRELANKPSFAAYTLFPLTRLLQLNSFQVFQAHQSVLSKLLDCLVAWIDPQHGSSQQSDILSQLWLVCTLILGGPIEDSPPSNPWEEDVRAHALQLLYRILKHPPVGMQRTVLAHTVTALLSPATSFDVSARTTALQSLSLLFLQHPQFTQEGLDVHFFPGLVSSLVKILLPQSTSKAADQKAPKQVPSQVVCEAFQLLAAALVQVLGNRSCSDLLRADHQIERLEDLADFDPRRPATEENENDPSGSSNTSNSDPTKRTRKWLDTTAQQVHLAILAILPTYRQLDHPDSKLAFARFCVRALDGADQTLHEATVTLLRMEVCALAMDPWPQVKKAVQPASKAGLKQVKAYQDILSQALLRLSGDILQHGDDAAKLGWSLNVLQGAASILLNLLTASQATPVRTTSLASETWALSLLRAVEFARLPGLHDPSTGDQAAKAWIAPAPTLLSVDNDPSDAKDPSRLGFPPLSMKHIPSTQLQAHLGQAVQLLGQLYIHIGLSSILEQFLDLATGGLAPELRASAWWIVSLLTACLNQNPEQVKLVKSVVQAACEVEEDQSSRTGSTSKPVLEEESGAAVERVKGLQIGSLLSDYNVDNDSSRAEAAARSRTSARLVMQCMSLRALAASSRVMETHFRSQLLFCLYPALAQLGATTHPLVREHAEVALQHIAFHSGYASTVNLVLDNVDYIINAVSQRLLLTQLDPRAPQVLIAVIRLVGEPVVPLLSDIVDDIFDALDSFHGYTTLCASLLAVLDCLVRSIARDDVGQRRAKPEPFYKAPDPAQDVDNLVQWLQEKEEVQDPEEEEADPFHGEPSAEAFQKVSEQLKSEEPRNDDKPDPPTKAQATCSAILSKSLYFLSHDSAFLRARVLGLVTSTVNVLGAQSRESEMLPFINRAWPIILNRLSPTEELFVVAEAARLVQELAAQVGDYACRKILDDAWPKFQELLLRQAALNTSTSHAAQGVHTSSHRLNEAVFETMRLVAEEVPLRDGADWQIATALKDVLLTTRDRHLDGCATDLFRALSKVSPEGVWLVLHGAAGDAAGLPRFMVGSNSGCISRILACLQGQKATAS